MLKCNHDSGSVIICKDKKTFDIESARRMLKKALRVNYYPHSKEWPYKNIKPKIIAEQFMVDESGYELKDYKFYAFNGEVKALLVATDRQSGNTKFDFYDAEWKHLPFTWGGSNSVRKINIPNSFEEMKRLASTLSEGLPSVRIDFYDVYGQIYFGEITFFPNSGFVPFKPEEWDYTLGSWITLPEKK